MFPFHPKKKKKQQCQGTERDLSKKKKKELLRENLGWHSHIQQSMVLCVGIFCPVPDRTFDTLHINL